MIPNWPLPTFAVVLEWDNARQSELARAHAMLRALRLQLEGVRRRVPAPPQVLLLYDRNDVPATVIERSLVEHFGPPGECCELRVEPVDGLKYYELKNVGATRTSGEIVVFLDSDTIPEPDWLQNILESFSEPDCAVVTGQTYMSTHSVYSRAFSLFWFFGLRSDRTDLAIEQGIFANNVAYRREIFERYPFPSGGLYRGQCVRQTDALRKDGIRIYRQYRAAVSHPPPVGVLGFIVRALWEGHDEVILRGRERPITLRGAFWLYRHVLVRTYRRVVQDYRRAGLGPAGAMFAFALGSAYCTVKLIGSALTLTRPSLLERWLPA
ncbi:MAG TPA: glycosyltransferase [Alphaproteobacteria bacterium]